MVLELEGSSILGNIHPLVKPTQVETRVSVQVSGAIRKATRLPEKIMTNIGFRSFTTSRVLGGGYVDIIAYTGWEVIPAGRVPRYPKVHALPKAPFTPPFNYVFFIVKPITFLQVYLPQTEVNPFRTGKHVPDKLQVVCPQFLRG